MIRQATSSDCDAIHVLSAFLGYGTVEKETAREWLDRIIHADHHRLLVYDKAEQVIGWIHAHLAERVASPPFVEIAGLVVDPDHRRQGVGAELVKAIEDWAGSMELKVRVRSNLIREETHGFYESLGFKKAKSQHVFEKNL